MKNNHIVSALGVIGLTGMIGMSSLSAQAPTQLPIGQPAPIDPAKLKHDVSYSIGFNFGNSISNDPIQAGDLDHKVILAALNDALAAKKSQVSEADTRVAMMQFQKKIQQRAMIARQEAAAKAKAQGDKFLAANKKRAGVMTTPSGLQYEIINKGGTEKYKAPADGTPDAGTKFLVNYRGTLIDGTEFDKSPEGKPVPFTLQVIPGFQEALKMMPVGSKWKLFIPSNLAYGERGAGQRIAPNSALIFDLELLEIQKPVPTPKASAVTPPVAVPTPPKPKK